VKFLNIILILIIAGGAWWFLIKVPNDSSSQPVVNKVTSTVLVQSAVKPKTSPDQGATSSPEHLMDQGRFQEALKGLESLKADLRPQNWDLSHVRALQGVGQREKALLELNALIERSSHGKKPSLLSLKGSMLLDDGQKDEAGEVFYTLFNEFESSSEGQDASYKLKDLWKSWLDTRDHDHELIRYSQVLSTLLRTAVDDQILAEIYRLLERLNARLFMGPKAIEGRVLFHTVTYGENLSGIAKKYGLAPARIAQVNGLKSWNAIRANQTLRIILGRVSIVVDKARFKMDVFLDGLFFKRYGVGLGRGGNTPTVVTTISRSMARNPSYTVPDTGEMIGAKDDRNPIGTRWIGLDIGRGFGIHGTREPNSIGKESSNGCIRMLNEHVEELYDYVMVGDEVEMR
jgi:hypothetical protein